jgi:hypothetical protein
MVMLLPDHFSTRPTHSDALTTSSAPTAIGLGAA